MGKEGLSKTIKSIKTTNLNLLKLIMHVKNYKNACACEHVNHKPQLVHSQHVWLHPHISAVNTGSQPADSCMQMSGKFADSCTQKSSLSFTDNFLLKSDSNLLSEHQQCFWCQQSKASESVENSNLRSFCLSIIITKGIAPFNGTKT